MKILFLLLFIPLVSLRLHTDDLFELEELLRPEHKSHIKSSYFDYLLGDNNNDENDDDAPRYRLPPKKTYGVEEDNDDDDAFVPPIKPHPDETPDDDDSPPDETTTRTKVRPKTEESSKCIDQYEIKSEQIVRVKYLQDNARLMRMISIEQPSASSQFSLKEICIMKCCAEKDCDLAMLSEQHTRVKSLPHRDGRRSDDLGLSLVVGWIQMLLIRLQWNVSIGLSSRLLSDVPEENCFELHRISSNRFDRRTTR